MTQIFADVPFFIAPITPFLKRQNKQKIEIKIPSVHSLVVNLGKPKSR
jgi:hypothetical protein